MFQSPRSEKFESNYNTSAVGKDVMTFQSPRSGKFESNEKLNQIVDNAKLSKFQSPRSGKFESNLQLYTAKSKYDWVVSIP